MIFLPGVWSGMAKIVQMEGFLGLYKGNAAQMVRVFPYAATQFGTFEYMNGVSRHSVTHECVYCDLSLTNVFTVTCHSRTCLL